MRILFPKSPSQARTGFWQYENQPVVFVNSLSIKNEIASHTDMEMWPEINKGTDVPNGHGCREQKKACFQFVV